MWRNDYNKNLFFSLSTHHPSSDVIGKTNPLVPGIVAVLWVIISQLNVILFTRWWWLITSANYKDSTWGKTRPSPELLSGPPYVFWIMNRRQTHSYVCRLSPFSWWFPSRCLPLCTPRWSWVVCPCRGLRWTWARWGDPGNAWPSPDETMSHSFYTSESWAEMFARLLERTVPNKDTSWILINH